MEEFMKYSALILLDENSQDQFSDLTSTISSLEGVENVAIVTSENLQEKASNLLQSITTGCCGQTGGEEIDSGVKIKYKNGLHWLSGQNQNEVRNRAAKFLSGDLTVVVLAGAQLPKGNEFITKISKVFKDDAVGLVYTDYYYNGFEVKYLPHFHPMIQSEFKTYLIVLKNSLIEQDMFDTDNLFQYLVKLMSRSIIKHLAEPLYQI